MTQKFTLGLGIVFIVVGLLGWLGGSHDHHFIIFGVNASHNLVHMLSGIAAVAAGLHSFKAARLFCLVFGVVYGLVTIGGFLAIPAVVQMLNLNMADNFLHLAITVSCLGVGLKATT